MNIDITINPPTQILVEAVSQNEYNVIVTAQSAIQVSVSSQAGVQGIQGEPGVGIPPLGAIGQHLAKVSNTSYDTQWVPAVGSALNKQVLFSDGGNSVGNTDFVFDKDLKALSIGQAIFLPDNPLGVSGNIDSYLQINVQNKNGGVAASSDYIATADDGTDLGIYADLGICNSGYESESWDVAESHDTYVFGDGGNIVIGTLSVGKKIKLFIADIEHEGHPSDVVLEIDKLNGLNMMSGYKVKENGFSLTDLITECSSDVEETAAFAAGSKIVIRTDLI
jgi:hypothetical protein